MANFVFYDFETSSSNKRWGQIIQIGAILVNDNLQELDRFESRCRLSPGVIPEAMALIVNKTTPQILKKTNLSHYQMVRQFCDTLKKWGKVTYIGYNSIDFDEEILRSTLFKTLEYPYLTSTNGNKRGDLLGLARAANLYYPNTLKNPISAKGNAVYKLDQIAPLNGIKHMDAHSAIGDAASTLEIAKIIYKKALNVWKASQMTTQKDETMKIIKEEKFFCTNEYFYGKSRPFIVTYVCAHPKYQWAVCFDLKQDPENYLNLLPAELKQEMSKNPKFLRTVRHNKHPIVMNPSYGINFEGYKELGKNKLEKRAQLIKSNKQFAEKLSLILEDIAQEKEDTDSQLDIYEEESIYKKFSPKEDNKIMNEFHKIDWKKKLKLIGNFKDERLKYFGKKLLYEESPENLSQKDFKEMHKMITERILSTNDEKWNTIPRTYAEIDTLRVKFDREGDKEKMNLLNDISNYIEEIEKKYSSA